MRLSSERLLHLGRVQRERRPVLVQVAPARLEDQREERVREAVKGGEVVARADHRAVLDDGQVLGVRDELVPGRPPIGAGAGLAGHLGVHEDRPVLDVRFLRQAIQRVVARVASERTREEALLGVGERDHLLGHRAEEVGVRARPCPEQVEDVRSVAGGQGGLQRLDVLVVREGLERDHRAGVILLVRARGVPDRLIERGAPVRPDREFDRSTGSTVPVASVVALAERTRGGEQHHRRASTRTHLIDPIDLNTFGFMDPPR